MSKRREFFTDNMQEETLACLISRIAFCLIGTLIPNLVLAQSGVVNSGWNPLQIGLLQWNTQGQPPAFAVGNAPRGVAFDGANIWVANQSDGTVTKLRASDGAPLSTLSVGGSELTGIAYDGANILGRKHGQ